MTKRLFIIASLLLSLQAISQSGTFGIWIPEGSIMGEHSDDLFGVNDMSDDGNILAGSLSILDPNINNYVTYVKVFQHNENSWSQIGTSISGDIRTMGSIDLNAAGNIMAISPSRFYGQETSWPVQIYQHAGNEWQQLGQTLVTGSNYAFIDAKLNGDGTKLVVCMVSRTNPENTLDYLRIYKFDGTEWVQEGADLALASAGDRISKPNISLDGNTISFLGSNTGNPYVSVYELNGSSWEQKGQILYQDVIEEDSSKKIHHVRMSGDGSTIAVSTWFPNMDALGTIYAYTYDAVSDNWIIEGQPIGEIFSGSEVSISTNGKRIATGHALAYPPDAQIGASTGEGRVFEFNQSSSSWSQIFFYQPSLYWVFYGNSVSISGDGNKLAMGATPEGTPGSISLYDYEQAAVNGVSVTTIDGEDQYIQIEETLQLEANVLPNEINQEVNWSIESGTEFISLDGNGLVIGIANGIAIVRATSVIDPNIFGSIQINVSSEEPEDDEDCSQDFNSNVVNGAVLLEPANYFAANDFDVAEGSIFNLRQIVLPVISSVGAPVSFNVSVYNDSGNMPGEEIITFPNVTPLTQSITGTINNTNYIYSSLLDLGETISLEGGNKYWLVLSASVTTEEGYLYWGMGDLVQTSPTYQSIDGGNSWTIISDVYDGIFTVIGTCEEILSTSESMASKTVYYPNPVYDVLTIIEDAPINSVNVYNLTGSNVKTIIPSNAKEIKIDFSDLSPGIYVVKIKTGNKSESIKVVKR